MRAFVLSRSRSLLRPHAAAPLSFWAPWHGARSPPPPDPNADADAVSAELARHPEYRVIAPGLGSMAAPFLDALGVDGDDEAAAKAVTPPMREQQQQQQQQEASRSSGGDDDGLADADRHPADPYAQEHVPPPRPDDFHDEGDRTPPSSSFPA
jgi:hypothetical protein